MGGGGTEQLIQELKSQRKCNLHNAEEAVFW